MNLNVEMTFIFHFILFTLSPVIYGVPVRQRNTVVKNSNAAFTTEKQIEIIVPIEVLTTERPSRQVPISFSSTSSNIVFSGENVKEKSNPNKIQSFDDDDYYGDYQSDSGKDISYSKLRLTTSPPLSLGCPQTHSVCQHYCESKNFYSGYCEGNFCHCYGKL